MWPPILTRFEGVHLLFVRDPEKWSLCEKTNHTIQQWYKEYTRYIKYNDPQSAYALHILNNKHEYGTLTDTMKVFKHISNPTMLFPSKLLFIHSYHHHKHLFPKQHIHEVNPYTKPFLMYMTRHLHTVTKSVPHQDQFFLQLHYAWTCRVIRVLSMYFNYCIP